MADEPYLNLDQDYSLDILEQLNQISELAKQDIDLTQPLLDPIQERELLTGIGATEAPGANTLLEAGINSTAPNVASFTGGFYTGMADANKGILEDRQRQVDANREARKVRNESQDRLLATQAQRLATVQSVNQEKRAVEAAKREETRLQIDVAQARRDGVTHIIETEVAELQKELFAKELLDTKEADKNEQAGLEVINSFREQGKAQGLSGRELQAFTVDSILSHQAENPDVAAYISKEAIAIAELLDDADTTAAALINAKATYQRAIRGGGGVGGTGVLPDAMGGVAPKTTQAVQPTQQTQQTIDASKAVDTEMDEVISAENKERARQKAAADTIALQEAIDKRDTLSPLGRELLGMKATGADARRNRMRDSFTGSTPAGQQLTPQEVDAMFEEYYATLPAGTDRARARVRWETAIRRSQ